MRRSGGFVRVWQAALPKGLKGRSWFAATPSVAVLRTRMLGLGLVWALTVAITGCASIEGYPADPENTAATLARLTPYFDGTEEKNYIALAANETARQQKRD